MLSMPRGTDPLTSCSARRASSRKHELADHKYVMVLHDHQANPHVHLSVRAEVQRRQAAEPAQGRPAPLARDLRREAARLGHRGRGDAAGHARREPALRRAVAAEGEGGRPAAARDAWPEIGRGRATHAARKSRGLVHSGGGTQEVGGSRRPAACRECPSAPASLGSAARARATAGSRTASRRPLRPSTRCSPGAVGSAATPSTVAPASVVGLRPDCLPYVDSGCRVAPICEGVSSPRRRRRDRSAAAATGRRRVDQARHAGFAGSRPLGSPLLLSSWSSRSGARLPCPPSRCARRTPVGRRGLLYVTLSPRTHFRSAPGGESVFARAAPMLRVRRVSH
ncbi:MAG: hypothetical protein MZW92_29635 [Comamonadaceae bacterium]|nr:hypothetical protein [Comamonadaceae bacterium]